MTTDMYYLYVVMETCECVPLSLCTRTDRMCERESSVWGDNAKKCSTYMGYVHVLHTQAWTYKWAHRDTDRHTHTQTHRHTGTHKWSMDISHTQAHRDKDINIQHFLSEEIVMETVHKK